MSLHRFYCDQITKPVVELLGTEAHHIASVRRLKPADKVELFDGKGTLATAVIVSSSTRKVTLQIEVLDIASKPNRPEIAIAASIPKKERFDWLITKCTELGIDRIIPVIFERTVKQPKNPKISERWMSLAVAAAKQSRRLFLPEIDTPSPLKEVLKKIKTDQPDALLLLGCPELTCPSIFEIPKTESNIIAFVGPEGGLTKDEKNFLCSNDCKSVRVTDTVLRVETAAIAFAAILSAQRDIIK